MPDRHVLLHGSPDPPPERMPLRAGPLTMLYEPDLAFLRYIRLGEREVLRGVYAAVRDRNWGTVPPRVHNLQAETGEDSFRLTFDVECREGPIDFFWHGSLTGEPDGTINFRMEGVTRSSFLRTRIGFCVLHPAELAGTPCRVEHPDGTVEDGAFPRFISPHQPFKQIRALSHEAAPGVTAEVRLEGDVFEMEDQRNWTDASFKSYCTPLDRPFPVEVREGDRVSQSVTLKLHGLPGGAVIPARPVASPSEVLFTFDEEPRLPLNQLPDIGLCVARDAGSLEPLARERLSRLFLRHLRLDVHPSDPQAADCLRMAAEQARALGIPLEITLFAASEAEFRAAADAARAARPEVARWLVFHPEGRSTPAGWIQLARRCLGEFGDGRFPPQIGGGTDAYFTQLNREQLPAEGLGFVCYSINPQVHAFDDASLVESLPMQGVTVESARELFPDLPIRVTPVTLRPRFNPAATAPEPEPDPDPRQASLFGAGWTLGSLKYLAEAGAVSVTYYETTGPRGVMDGAGTLVYPVYHVFADVGEYRGLVVPSRSSEPLHVEGMVLGRDDGFMALLANLTGEPQRVRLRCPPRSGEVSVRFLDETNAEAVMLRPETFRAAADGVRPVRGGELVLDLRPHALARATFSPPGAREPE